MENDQTNHLGMIDRYVYDVIWRLPKAQREDIDQELRGLIEDMLEQAGPNPGKEDVEEVLIGLGRPSELAAKYRGNKSFLIGPEMFDTYFLVSKIVLGATALGLTIAIIIGAINTPPQNFWSGLRDFFTSLLSAVAQAFVYVTVAFALIERFTKKKDSSKRDTWKPIDLPEVPKAKARIKPSGAIIGIVFSVIVLMLFNTVPHLISVYAFSGTISITPIFDLDTLRSMILFIDVILFLNIAKEAFRLVYGRYTIGLATAVTVINAAAIILIIMVFLPPALWNSELVPSFVPKIIVGLAVFGNVVEIITSWTRGVQNTLRK